MAGYSSAPLAKKLGMKPGFRMLLINAPEYYLQLFADLPEDIHWVKSNEVQLNMVHFFTKEATELHATLPLLMGRIVSNGVIWVSWPKRSAGIATDVSENMIRDLALKIGLVDIKVCAVDEVWSGLKLVIPVKDRT